MSLHSKNETNIDDTEIKKENVAEPESGSGSLTDESKSKDPKKEVKDKKESKKKNKYKEELKALNEKYMRLLAEYDNYRKRSTREIQSILCTATEDLVKALLPIIDNLDLATEHKEKQKTLEEYVKGIALIEDQLRDILDREGLKHIEAVGQPFDPNLHEAILQIDSDEHESGIVTNETQKGYMFSNKVIRHSKVVVSK
ncbi:nucleotide exchange factor GrpE [Candidatus Latescibacterota bacterium]